MNKDFVEVANDSGTNNGSFDVVCGQNSGDERSTILTVSGGVSKTVAVKQAGGSYKNKTFVIALGNNLLNVLVLMMLRLVELKLYCCKLIILL